MVDPLAIRETINQLSDLCLVIQLRVWPIAWIESKEQKPSAMVNIGVEFIMNSFHISTPVKFFGLMEPL